VAAGRIADAAANAYYLAEWSEGMGVDAARLEVLVEEAYDIAADAPPGPLTALPAYVKAYRFMIEARYAEGLAFSEREIARAQAAGDAQAVALLQMWRGGARMGTADAGGIEDLRTAYRTLDRYAHPKAAAAAANFAEMLIVLGHLDEAEEVLMSARGWTARTGQSRLDRVALAMLAFVAYHRGDRERVAELLDAAERIPVADSFSGANILLCRARLDLDARPYAALERAREALRFAETIGNDEQRADAYAVIARAEVARGDARAAGAVADGFVEHWRASGVQQVWSLPEIGLVLAAAGRHEELAELLERRFVANPWADAARALAAQDYDGAAAVLEAVPSIPLRDAVRELAATTV
jgi:tetratricopeptide (TPR) repeat protein